MAPLRASVPIFASHPADQLAVGCFVAPGLGSLSRKEVAALLASADVAGNGAHKAVLLPVVDGKLGGKLGEQLAALAVPFWRQMREPAARDGDALIVYMSDQQQSCQLLGGQLRLAAAQCSRAREHLVFDSDKFVWIVDFPLFERNDEQQLASTHHPFTAPIKVDEEMLFKVSAEKNLKFVFFKKKTLCQNNLNDLLKIRGQHYDLVSNERRNEREKKILNSQNTGFEWC